MRYTTQRINDYESAVIDTVTGYSKGAFFWQYAETYADQLNMKTINHIKGEIMNGTIVLTKHSFGWMADYSDTVDAALFIRDFGTAKLPTPFTAFADVETVKSEIAKRNPGFQIAVEV